MKIAVIEPNHCHHELLPSWGYYLAEHEVDYWVTKKAKKMDVFSVCRDPSPSTKQSVKFPMFNFIDQMRFNSQNYDAAIFNTERCYKTGKLVNDICGDLKVPKIIINHHRKQDYVIDDRRVQVTNISTKFGGQHVAPVYFKTDDDFTNRFGRFFVIPGRVTENRRCYEVLGSLLEALPEGVRVMILGDLRKKKRYILDSVINHPRLIINSEDTAFYPFINTIKSSLGILPLVEPEMHEFTSYVSDVQSGNLNLSLSLGVPLVGNELYLKEVSSLFQGHAITYKADRSNVASALEKAISIDKSQLYSIRQETLAKSSDLINTLLTN